MKKITNGGVLMIKNTNTQRSIVIPKEIAENLNKIANDNYITTTALIRRILIEYVNKNNKK